MKNIVDEALSDLITDNYVSLVTFKEAIKEYSFDDQKAIIEHYWANIVEKTLGVANNPILVEWLQLFISHREWRHIWFYHQCGSKNWLESGSFYYHDMFKDFQSEQFLYESGCYPECLKEATYWDGRLCMTDELLHAIDAFYGTSYINIEENILC